MNYGPYCPLKAAHISHASRMNGLKSGIPVPPAQAHLIATNKCNHNCRFCAYRSEYGISNELFDRSSEIDRDRGLRLIDELAGAGVSAINFTGGGEPLVHPNFSEFCQKVHDTGMKFSIMTNGTLLHTIDPELLSKASWIRVSIDAASEETYRHVRRCNNDLDDLMLNLVRLQRYFSTVESPPIFGAGFVVTEDNYTEVGDFVRMVDHISLDNCRVTASILKNDLEKHQKYVDDVVYLMEEVKEEVSDDFHIFDLFSNRKADLEQTSPEYKTCYYSRLVPYIAADLNVYCCCILAYTERGCIGSLKNKSFQSLWYKDGFDKLMSIDARECPMCMFNNHNRFINYMLDDDSEHVEFI